MPRIPNESLDHIVSVFEENNGILTTAEAEAHFDYSRSGIWRRLTRLEQEGLLDRERDGRDVKWILQRDAANHRSGELYEGYHNLSVTDTDAPDE